MTDEKFTELINLYLDKEISEEELNLLKEEIGKNSDRKRILLERCRLHKAMRLALRPENEGRSGRVVPFPRWLLAPGLAAGFLVGFILLQPAIKDSVEAEGEHSLAEIDESGLTAQDLASLGKSDVRRFVLAQEQNEAGYHASLISQMRLMGLRPELTPRDKQLQEINLAANYKPKQEVNQAELFQRIQALKALPEHKIFSIDEKEIEQPVIWTEPIEPSLSVF